MRIKLNENFKNLKESYLFSEIARRVREFMAKNPSLHIIKLGIGDVTLPLPKAVTAAMNKAVEEMSRKETFRGYAPEYGYDFLRESIAEYYKTLGVNLSSSEIFVSDGAKNDISNIVDILGDNPVLIPNPVYPVYLDSNIMSGRRVQFLNAGLENGFLPMPHDLECTTHNMQESYVIYLCSPNNPTGSVYDRGQLKTWVDFAALSGSLIIFDNAYEAFIECKTQENLPHSIFEIGGARECAVEIGSFSKMAGFTGTRCSWAIIPEELNANGTRLIELWRRRQATKFNGVPYVIQRGAEAALSPNGLVECRETVNYYMQNARILASLLEKKGVFFTGGTSSPYLWLKCPRNLSSREFFDELLNNAQIVGTPGAGFGEQGEGYFRLTSFGNRENIIEAAARLEKFL